MSKLSSMRGSMVALITPFESDRVDEDALAGLVEWHIKEGTHVIVPSGTTGESPTLSHEEHKRVVEVVIQAAAGRVPVMAGTGSNATSEAIDLTRHAEAAGADGALIVTPYYNRPTQDGLYAHFAAIHNAVGAIPQFIYNVPARSAVDMSVETMGRLAALPHIVGVKDATANLARVSLQRIACGEDFIQISGEDATALGFMANGGLGCISVSANVAPRLCAQFQELCLAGNYAAALEVHDKLSPLHDVMFKETSPGPVKYAVSRVAHCKADLRLPLVDIAPETARAVDSVLDSLGLI
jgi:4-hydroxy-tetrahydrodipicolinate synthase